LSRSARLVVFLGGAAGLAALVLLAVFLLPSFGSSSHPYRDHAIAAATAHASSNAVSSLNFDQRGLDTLGEESILLASVVGAATLLRPAADETETRLLSAGRTLDSTRLLGYILMPLTLLIGFDVIAHGHLTPGGGFQGGVVVGTGIHLLYVAGNYPALQRARPLSGAEWGEALGSAAFACLGIAGLLVSGSFLANVIPFGRFGNLFSSGTVALLNGAVGIEVASGTAVLLAKFLDQAILVKPQGSESSGSSESAGGAE
jgi:multicomponent Na+:H+ antiporter subunit B